MKKDKIQFDFLGDRSRQHVKSSWQILLNYFLRGLLVLLPIALTVGIIIWLVNTVTAMLNLDNISTREFIMYALGVVALILLVGFITRGVVAQQILNFVEGIIEKAPGLSFIFGTTRDMTEAFVGDKKKFNSPVLVKAGEGLYRMGFLTQEDMTNIDMPGHCAVYLPYSYGLSGEMLVVEKSMIKPVNKDSGDWTKFIISGGVAELEKE
jgi:uncharacterized membrane protein